MDGHEARLLGAFVVVAVLVPVRSVPWLPGGTVDTAAELATFATGLMLLAFGSPMWPRLARLALVPAAAAIVLKVALSFATPVGFSGCYQIVTPSVTPPPTYRCERSYDDPLADSRTRLDRRIDFRTWGRHPGLRRSNWLLSAANSHRYDYYPPMPINRDRLEFNVVWTGTIGAHRGVAITYVGEGDVKVGQRSAILPPSYGRSRTVTVPADGTVPIRMRYAWTPADGSGPAYAAISLRDAHGALVAAVPAERSVRGVALLAGICLAIAVAVAAGMLAAEILRSRVAVLVLLASLAAAVVIATGHGPSAHSKQLTGLFMLLAVVPWVAVRARVGFRLMMLAGAAASGVLAVAVVRATTGVAFGVVTYRDGGGDPLTYESQARSILVDRNLRAGESTFVYSAAMRYLMYLQHLVTGDRDGLIYAFGLMGLSLGLLYAVEMLVARGRTPPVLARGGPLGRVARAGGFWLVVGLSIVYLGTADVATGSYVLRSEYPTWICMLVVVPLALRGRSVGAALAASVLLGVMFTFRGDQTIGLLTLAGVLLVRLLIRRRAGLEGPAPRRAAAAVLLPALCIALLPFAHNVGYGGRAVFLQQTPRLPETFPLSPTELLQHPTDRHVRIVLRNQLAGVLVIRQWYKAVKTTNAFEWAVRCAQFGLLALPVIVLVWFRRRWWIALLPLIPISFLIGHVFVQVYYYYPRHIVAGYLAGCLVLIAAFGDMTASPEDRDVLPRRPSP